MAKTRAQELDSNPNRLKNESNDSYNQRVKYNAFRLKQQEDKNLVKKYWNKVENNINNESNYFLKSAEQVVTSPIRFAKYLDNKIDIQDVNKYRNDKAKSEVNQKGLSSAMDIATLATLGGLDSGLKSKAMMMQLAKKAGKYQGEQFIQDVGFGIYNINDKADGGYINNELNPKYNNYLNMRQYAQGGDLTRFNEGGTHEASPLGGIPQGQAPDGSQNRVEQGESKKGNFIYSNRIELNKDLIKQFNLPGYVANKSVSDASKAIDDKFKDRADKYAQETKKTLLDRLANAQEYLKQQEQATADQANQSMQANSQQIPDQMNGQVPEGMEEYVKGPNSNPQEEQVEQMQGQQQMTSSPIAAFGGYQINKFFNGGVVPLENSLKPAGLNTLQGAKITAPQVPASAGVAPSINPQETAGTPAGAIVNAASTAFDLGKTAFGKAAQDTTGQAESAKVDKVGMIGNSALKGAQAGAAFGPWGAAIGGVVGAGAGILGSNKAEKAALINGNNFGINTNNKVSDNYAANGGTLNIDPNKKAIPITKDGLNNLNVAPGTRTSDQVGRYTKIVGYQPGVTEGKTGRQGAYVYSPELAGGREFVNSSGLASLHNSDTWRQYQTSMKAQIASEQAAGLPVSSYANLTNKFFDGGNLNGSYNPNLDMSKIFKVKENLNPQVTQDLMKKNDLATNSSALSAYNNEAINPGFYSTQKQLDGDRYSLKNRLGRAGETLNENAGDLMRLAPVAMNAYQLKNLKKPQGFQYQTLDNRYKPSYVDEAQMQRNVDQEGRNTLSAIGQMGGSEGAIRNAILASGINNTRGLSDAYANASAQNRAQDAAAQQFNLGVDSQNTSIRNKAIDEMRADKGAYDSAKSKYLSAIGTDIGDIGKEKNASDAAIAMFGYTRKGKYVVDKNGNKVSPEELSKRQADYASYISEQNKKDRK